MTYVGLSIALRLFSPLSGTTPDGGRGGGGEGGGGCLLLACRSPVTPGYAGCARGIDPMLL